MVSSDSNIQAAPKRKFIHDDEEEMVFKKTKNNLPTEQGRVIVGQVKMALFFPSYFCSCGVWKSVAKYFKFGNKTTEETHRRLECHIQNSNTVVDPLAQKTLDYLEWLLNHGFDNINLILFDENYDAIEPAVKQFLSVYSQSEIEKYTPEMFSNIKFSN